MVSEEILKRDLKNIHYAPSSIFPSNAILSKLIENKNVTNIDTNYLNGPVAKTIGEGKLEGLLIMNTHGGRPRKIESGELPIDVAFIACPNESYSGEYDCGLLSQNMMLSAWSMGIGSCCLGSVVPVMNSEAAKPYYERLQLPEDYKLMLAIAFGYPAGDAPQAPERDASKAFYVE